MQRLPVLLAAAALALPAATAETGPNALSTLNDGQGHWAAPWRLSGLPHQRKPFTRFSAVEGQGVAALRIEADRSYGNLVHPLAPTRALHHLAWLWRLDEPNAQADLRERALEDMAARVCVVFDLPLQRLPLGERNRLRLARALSDEPLPSAVLCYVWDAKLAPDTEVESPYTRRLRSLVLHGPQSTLRQWMPEHRDVDADFLRLFGDESGGDVPPIVGVLVGADADNTQGRSVAWVAGLSLAP